MAGALPLGSVFGVSSAFRELLGGGTFAKGDLVKLSSGEAVVATAGDSVLGVANEAATSASTGVQIDITPGLIVEMDNDLDSDTFGAADIGNYGDIIGSSGAHLVDTSSLSGTVATLFCIERVDATTGRFVIKEHLLY